MELRWSHDRQSGRICAIENQTCVDPGLAVSVGDIRAIAHQAPSFDKLAQEINLKLIAQIAIFWSIIGGSANTAANKPSKTRLMQPMYVCPRNHSNQSYDGSSSAQVFKCNEDTQDRNSSGSLGDIGREPSRLVVWGAGGEAISKRAMFSRV